LTFTVKIEERQRVVVIVEVPEPLRLVLGGGLLF
jgi:hypothetical protein